jgi:hypothetical protein
MGSNYSRGVAVKLEQPAEAALDNAPGILARVGLLDGSETAGRCLSLVDFSRHENGR